MTSGLVALAIQELPSVLEILSMKFKKENPGVPEPTKEQIMAAYRQAFKSSLEKDEAWLAAHPEDAPEPEPDAEAPAEA